MTERDASSIQEVVEALSLDLIAEVELLGTVRASDPPGEDDGSVQVDFLVQQPDECDKILVTVTTRARNGDVFLRVVHDLTYALEVPLTLKNEGVRRDLLNQLVVFHVTPYAREALQTLATRLRIEPPLIPLLKVGEVSVGSRQVEREQQDD